MCADISHGSLNALIAASEEARAKSYSPYSNYAVGAAILAENGEIYSGTNVENAAYPLGTCAEAGAIAAMVLAGQHVIKAVVIASPNNEMCTPCGGCRQKLAEFAPSETPVYGVNLSGHVVYRETVGTLLPLSFKLDENKASL